jgi:AhpD family alkylhydroperoxidase
MTYSDPTDVKHLRDIRHAAPKEFEAWLNLDKIVGREDGAIPRKYRELIAIAVAVTTQCPYCLDAHTKAAKENGVTEAELSEAVMIATALRAGAGATHGALAMKLFKRE